jgi:hypothetical protein
LAFISSFRPLIKEEMKKVGQATWRDISKWSEKWVSKQNYTPIRISKLSDDEVKREATYWYEDRRQSRVGSWGREYGCRKSLSCRAIAPDAIVDLLCPSREIKGFREDRAG